VIEHSLLGSSTFGAACMPQGACLYLCTYVHGPVTTSMACSTHSVGCVHVGT
jgi:hypothetical protein